jgi:hypothetical protein
LACDEYLRSNFRPDLFPYLRLTISTISQLSTQLAICRRFFSNIILHSTLPRFNLYHFSHHLNTFTQTYRI